MIFFPLLPRGLLRFAALLALVIVLIAAISGPRHDVPAPEQIVLPR